VRAGRAEAVHEVFNVVNVIVKLIVVIIFGPETQLAKAAIVAVESTIRELLFLLVLAMGSLVSFLTLTRLPHLTVVVVVVEREKEAESVRGESSIECT
jgi:hypothetical protein